ncbi:MAG TPA: hypothetical protein VK563_00130 [Puia sp.]|nr:hypothetical protein [Puia sp.]
MKRLILSLLIPFAGQTGIYNGYMLPGSDAAAGDRAISNSHTVSRGQIGATSQVEIRSGVWPILLEKSNSIPGAAYSLQFRDMQVITGVVMDTLPFPDLGQLKYFGKALSALKTGNNGDIARFKEYSVSRADKKYEGVWYLLKYQWGTTDFQQPEADIIIKAIRDF